MSTPITQAHRRLACKVLMEHSVSGAATKDGVIAAAQLIADSEAAAVAQWSGGLDQSLPDLYEAAKAERDQLRDLLTEWKVSAHIKGESIDSLLAECDRLRAARDECERQFQDKVQRLGEEVEVTNQLRAENTLLRAAQKISEDTDEQIIKEVLALRAEVERITEDNTQLHASFVHHQARAELAEAELAAEQARLDWLLSRMRGLVLPANKCVAWTVDVYDYQNRFPSRAAIDAAMKEGAK